MKEKFLFKGKIIGEVDLEKKYYITHRTREHVFRKFGNGFGLSTKVIDALYERDIELIVINFEGKEFLWVHIDRFAFKGETWKDGDDEQLVLAREHWQDKPSEEHIIQEKLY